MWAEHGTEVWLVSFFASGFIIAVALIQYERRLAKRISLHHAQYIWFLPPDQPERKQKYYSVIKRSQKSLIINTANSAMLSKNQNGRKGLVLHYINIEAIKEAKSLLS